MRSCSFWARALSGLFPLVCACAVASSPPREASGVSGEAWQKDALVRYEVIAEPSAEHLRVEAELPAGVAALQLPGPLVPYISSVEAAARGGAWTSVAASRGGWLLPECLGVPCRARYRVSLGRAARELRNREYADVHRGVILSPASSWLLLPERFPATARYKLRVRTPPNLAFVTGTLLDERDLDAYSGFLVDLENAHAAAFGPLSVKRLALPGGLLDIAISPGASALPRFELERWVETQARAVASYFGRFAISHAAVIFLLERGRGISGGRTTGHGGGSVVIALGERSTSAELAEDWVLVHELVHVCFPDVHELWAEEGLATYVEPLVRVRAGLLDPGTMWRELLHGLPQGQPQPGDRGLAHTDTWGRRYWGGAMYWFLADIEARKRTNNARSIDDALRRIVARGGNVAVSWRLEQVLAEGDRALGGSELAALRRRLGEAPVTVDLEGLFRSLGIEERNGRIVYDDRAPLAAVRRGIATAFSKPRQSASDAPAF